MRTAALFVASCGLALSAPASASVVTHNPLLPPDTGEYITAAEVHATFVGQGLTIVLMNVHHRPATETTIRYTFNGVDEFEVFDALLTFDVSINGGDFMTMSGNSHVITTVLDKVGNTTGTFDTEMLQLDLGIDTPFGPIRIRESPDHASDGETTVDAIANDMYRITSMFGVWPELSLDNGISWLGSLEGQVPVVLVPAPGALLLLAPVMIARRRRA